MVEFIAVWSITNNQINEDKKGMPTIKSVDCLQIQKHPQKRPSASEAALRRQEEERCCLWRTMQGLWVCIQRETSKTREQRAQECDVESQHQQWTCSTGWTNQHQVDWKAAKTREMEGIILEEEGAGSPAHPLPAAHLWPGLLILPGYHCLTILLLLTNFITITWPPLL